MERELARLPDSAENRTMNGKARQRGVIATGAAVGLALAMLSDGRARNKTHAAQLAGVDEGALKPKALARFIQNNPIGRKLNQSAPDVLTITAFVDGKRMSMREALCGGVESSVAILGKLGPRLAKLTKPEMGRFKNAKQWLDLCRSCGLFAAPQPLALPSELQPQADSSPKPDGSVDEFLESHDEPQSSTEDEAITVAHNVEA